MTETEREITFRFERRAVRSFFGETCEKCSAKLLTLNEAVQISEVVWDEIVRLIKTEKIHFTQTANGEVFVCAASHRNFSKK
jgi:hypothetical protein